MLTKPVVDSCDSCDLATKYGSQSILFRSSDPERLYDYEHRKWSRCFSTDPFSLSKHEVRSAIWITGPTVKERYFCETYLGSAACETIRKDLFQEVSGDREMHTQARTCEQ